MILVKRRSTFLLIISACVVFLILIQECLANMAVTPLTYLPYYYGSCIVGYFLTVIIEYLIGYRFADKSPFYLKGILLTNFISYPIALFTLGLFYFIMYPQYLIYIVIIVEIMVILIEWFVLYHFYKKCDCLGKLNTKIRILNFSILANISSYILGSILFIGLFPETSLFYWIFLSS